MFLWVELGRWKAGDGVASSAQFVKGRPNVKRPGMEEGELRKGVKGGPTPRGK